MWANQAIYAVGPSPKNHELHKCFRKKNMCKAQHGGFVVNHGSTEDGDMSLSHGELPLLGTFMHRSIGPDTSTFVILSAGHTLQPFTSSN